MAGLKDEKTTVNSNGTWLVGTDFVGVFFKQPTSATCFSYSMQRESCLLLTLHQ